MTTEPIGIIELLGGPLDGEIIEDQGVPLGGEFKVPVARGEYPWPRPARKLPLPKECTTDVEPWCFNKQRLVPTEKVWNVAIYRMDIASSARFVKLEF